MSNLIGRQVKVISECGIWGEVGDVLTIVAGDELDSPYTVDKEAGLVEMYAIDEYPHDFELLPQTSAFFTIDTSKLQGAFLGEITSELTMPRKPVKSDGGSSSYYDIPLPPEFIATLMERLEGGNPHVRTEELIRYVFGNDFDFGTAFKSMVRARGITQGGGKEGNDIRYECNKVKYYAEKIATINE